MKNRFTLLSRIYRLKAISLAFGSLLLGVGLLTLSRHVIAGWLTLLPVSEVGGTLTAAGIFGIAWDFIDARDKEEREDERIRRLLKESASDFRDAVIAGFAETPANMRGVATTETLDKLATNALALRLGDERFASEIYAGLLAQAIRTPERWHDVDVAVRLSSIDESSTNGAARVPGPLSTLFDVIVTWEYTLRPSTRVQRFASTNSADEFHDFLDDEPATSTWFIAPESGADARERQAFELLSYTVDGAVMPIRRVVRKHGQTYSVDLGAEAVLADQPVRIRHVYRTVSRRAGHRFRVALTQPTEGLHVSLDYSDTDIAELKVGDMVSSAHAPQVSFLPSDAPARQVEIVVPGWLLPQAEVTFVWTLQSELPAPQFRDLTRKS